MKKRILSMLLAAILMLSVIPSAAAAESEPVTDAVPSVQESELPTAEPEETAAAAETAAPETEPASENFTGTPAAEPETAPASEAVTEAPAAVRQKTVDMAPTATGYPEITRIVPTAKGLKLTWNAFEGAYKYMVFIRKDGGGWKKIGETTATSFEHKGLTDNTVYVYTVRAAAKDGKFISTAYTKGWSFRRLSTPELLRTESTNEGQKLLWNPVEGAEVYRVFIKSGDKWIVAGTTDTCYCINSRVTSGKAYTYTVRCWDADNGVALSYFDTKGCTGVYVATPQITSFNAVSGGVTVSFDKVDGAARYAVFRKLSTGWKRLGITAKTSFDDIGLRYSARYTYTVRCIDKSGKYCSGYNTKGWSFTHLEPPKITRVTASNGKPTLLWSKNDAFASFKVFRKPFLGKWTEIGRTAKTSFTDTAAPANTPCTYAFRGLDQNGKYLTYFTDTLVYYNNGARANGKITVNGTSFRFSNGKLVSGFYTVNKRVYFYNTDLTVQKNGIVGSKTAGYTYADKNGVCCTSKEIRLAAEYMMKYCTGSTLKQKAKTGFLYMAKNFPYNRTYDHPKRAADIPALAIDMFTNEKGNCFRYAACFACIAKIAGYRVRMVIGTTGGSPHGWTEVLVNGKWLICDPDAQLPGYHVPDYYPYMMTHHYWQLSPHIKSELIIDANGRAVWK